MNRVIVLVMHGMTPSDFPQDEKKEFMRLHTQVHTNSDSDPDFVRRHDELENKMRHWPRSEQNDPFCMAAMQLAESMEQQSGQKVFLGFNEFCAPSFESAIASAVDSGPEEVCVVTPMVTRGGVHSEVEIPEIIEKAKADYPNIKFSYAWPYDPDHTAEFLLNQISRSSK
ncbi:MAG: CbiX/SirB N-terminal domain-containing protein [Candidatus Omnitrophica bacterium]|nr:CbiX/SirB N-terminal domain-containing protein [Candidatus Omnitrophota bacterium]